MPDTIFVVDDLAAIELRVIASVCKSKPYRVLSMDEVSFLLNLDNYWETPCPALEPNHSDSRLEHATLQHCACWYDGDACCGCGAGASAS